MSTSEAAPKNPLLCSHCGLACASRNELFRHLAKGCDPDVARAKKSDKVRLALAISYLGTSYHGCVGNEKDEEQYPTVEGRVLRAVRKAWGDDVVLGVARCTRTERSVHAATNILVLTVRGDREHPESRLHEELVGSEISLIAPIKPAPGVFDKVYAPKKRVYSHYVPYSALLTKEELQHWQGKSDTFSMDDGVPVELWVAPLVGCSVQDVLDLCKSQGLEIAEGQIELPSGKTEARLTLPKHLANEVCEKLDGLIYCDKLLFAMPSDEAFAKFAIQRRMRQGVKTLRGPLKGLRSFHNFIPETKKGDPMAMRQLQHCAAGSAFTDIRPGRGLRPSWPQTDWAILTFSASDFGPQQLRRMCGALVTSCRGSETPDYLDRCFAGQKTRADAQARTNTKAKAKAKADAKAAANSKPEECTATPPQTAARAEEHEHDEVEEVDNSGEEEENRRSDDGDGDGDEADAILLAEQESGRYDDEEDQGKERENDKEREVKEAKDDKEMKDDGKVAPEEDFDLAPAAPAETLSLDFVDYGHRAGDWLGPMDVQGPSLDSARRRIEVRIVEVGAEPWRTFLAQLDAGASRARLNQRLFDAALEGSEEALEEVLRSGAWPNALNDYNETPLIAAALSGKVPVVRRLLEARSDVRHASNGGATALAVARARCLPDLVQVLLDAGGGSTEHEGSHDEGSHNKEDDNDENHDQAKFKPKNRQSPAQPQPQHSEAEAQVSVKKFESHLRPTSESQCEPLFELALDDERGMEGRLQGAKVTEVLPLSADHAGAGSVVVDGAFSEKFLENLENLWRGLPLAPKDKFSTNERSYYHDIGGWITGPLDRAIALAKMPEASYATPLMRFLWYPQVGGSLPAHVDLSRKGDDGTRSTYTFIIYLGDCGEGGETNLLECLPGDAALAPSGGVAAGTRRVLHSVTPKRGRLLLFPHICPHSASPVLCPNKVLLRGEVFPPRKMSEIR